MRKWLSLLLACFALAHLTPANAQSITGAQSSLSYGPTICLYGNAFADGCAGANQNASFTVQAKYGTSFYTQATNGQPWTSPHPQPYNVAAIDFPIGPDKSAAFKDWLNTAAPTGCAFEVPGTSTGNPFNKVTTAGSSISGTTWTIGTLTSGSPEPGQMLAGAGIPTTGANVPYVVSGSGLSWTITNAGGLSIGSQAIFAGGARFLCSSGTPLFDGWDFTTGGGGQVRSSGGAVSFKNDKFANGSWTNFAGGYNISSVAGTSGGSLTIENSLFDGAHVACTITASYATTALTVTSGGTCGANVTLHAGQLLGGGTLTASGTAVSLTSNCNLLAGSGNCTISGNSATGGPSTLTVEMADWSSPISWNSTNCSISVTRTAFINQPANAAALGGINCPITWTNNYSFPIGLNTLSKVHLATVVAGVGNTDNATVPAINYLYNVSGYSAFGGSGGSTCFSINGTTGRNTVFTVGDIEGNTCVNSVLSPSGGFSNSTALFFLNAAGAVGTFTAKDNFVDPTGTITCIATQTNTTFNFFIDDGSTPGTYSGNPGNVLTIIAPQVVNINGAVYPGQSIGSTSVVYGKLQAYGAGGTSGVGGAGSYVFTGSPVAVGPSVAGKGWDTPVGTLITGPAGKVATNLRNGEDIAVSGVQWNSGNCTRS